MIKILTIVVPAYNIEKYIDTIMTSLLHAKNFPKLEIIIVNDGSSDKTKEKAQIYQNSYRNSVILIDKDNGGHGSTINAAINVATGKYFKVIDGDDWVNSDALDSLVYRMETISTDMVVTDYSLVSDEKTVVKHIKVCESECEYGKSYAVDEICKVKFPYPFHSVFWKTSIFKKSKKIDEKCFYVDIEYALYPLQYVQNFICFPDNVYMYRVGRDGQSVSREGYIKHRKDIVTVLFSLCSFYNENNLEVEKKEYILKRIQGLYATIVEVYLLLGKEDAKDYLPVIDQRLNKEYKCIFKKLDNKLACKIRIANYRGMLFFRLYRKLKKSSL